MSMNNLKKVAFAALAALFCVPAHGAISGKASLDVYNENIASVIARTIRQKNEKTTRLHAPVSADKTTNAYTWGTLRHENGYTWYYTQTYEDRGWYYGASDITIYDNDFNTINTIRVEIPEGMNVNDIEPTGFITTDFFDGDAATFEMPVFVHAVDNGKQINKMGIYRIADGEKVMEYDGYSMLNFRASDSYNRILLVRYPTESEKMNNLYVDVLKPVDGAAPVVEHTFDVNQDLLLYSDGSCINYFSLNGEPYYTVSHYENICMDGYDPSTYVPIQAPDNRFTIKTYNAEYAMVDSVSIKIDPTTPEATYGFATFSLFSNKDLRLGDFTNDKQFNYIVTHYEYFAQSDDYIYHIRVYDSESNLVNTIDENVTTWFTLSDIEGFEEQATFLKVNSEGAQYLEMVDIPSCQVAAVLPSVIDGNLISTTLDRCPVEDDYQYVISLSQATENAEGEAIARIGWYKRDCTVDHYVEFNIGKNAEGFTPYITEYVLNPYLFNTDAKREYFYLAMNKRTDGSEVLDKVLYLADEDGNVLRTIKPDKGDEIEFSSGDVFDYYTDSPRMLLSFYNGDNDAFEIQFYNLPFDKFTSGGEGTAEKPYVITTPGELAQIHTEPAAHYVLGNDIDMSTYTFPYYGAAEFTGTFDGNNHVISNIELNGNGLFGIVNGSISNLQIQSPVLYVSENASGILANKAIEATIENVHIYDAVIVGNEEAIVGGVIAAAVNTTFSAVSLLRANIDEYDEMGGIAATTSNCNINAVVTTGIMQQGNVFGGVSVSASGSITNSHTLWEGTATEVVAGVAAYSNANISHCYTQGSFDSLFADNEAISNVAGIVCTQKSGTINGCVTTLDNIVATQEENAALLNNYSQNQMSDNPNSEFGAYKSLDDMNSTFFESLGYAYGNTVDAPWVGEGLPLLYFENDRQSVSGIYNDDNNILYDGASVYADNATTIALYNMQGQLVATTNNKVLNVADVATGVYVVVAVDSNDNSESRKIVVK